MILISFAFINLKRMFKDKKALIGIFLAPIMVVGIMTLIMPRGDTSERIAVIAVDEDQSPESLNIINQLTEDETLDIQISSRAQALEQIKNKRASLAFVIPKDFSQTLSSSVQPSIDILQREDSPSSLLMDKINTLVKEESLKLKFSGEKDAAQQVSPISLTVQDEYTPYRPGLLLGLIINFMMYSMIYIIQDIHDLKRWKILWRTSSAPITGKAIMGGLLLAFFALIVLQNIALHLLTYFILGSAVIPQLFGGTLLFVSFILVILSMGVALANVWKSSNLAPVIVNLIVIPTGIISGTFIPTQFMPELLKKFSFLSPQYWVYSGIEKLTDGSVTAVLPHVGILLLLALCFFTAGTLKSQSLISTENNLS